MIDVIQGRQGWSYSVGILVSLLALIALKNRTIKLNNDSRRILACSLFGIALTIINVQAGAIYALIGLILLIKTQLLIMSNGKPLWFLIGGNPLHKLDDTETKGASIGIAMMLSVACTFFVKVLWLTNSL